MADSSSPTVVAHGAASSNPSYLEWGPVWAGAIVAVAMTTILIQFGGTAGLAMGEPVRADGTVSYNFIVAALWLLLVSASSAAAAGYISGRMRMTMNDSNENEVEFRDGIHGIVAWALATVFVATAASVFAAVTSAVVAAETGTTPEISETMQNFVANQTVIVGFATAAGSALGAAAAWFAAVSGGKHRNEGTAFHAVVPGMFRKK